MTKHLVRVGWRLAVVLMLAAVGCGRGGTGNLAQVSGTVTYNGQPVTDAWIILYDPTLKADQKFDLESDGSFKIVTPDGGFRPGTYQVVIRPYPEEPPPEDKVVDKAKAKVKPKDKAKDKDKEPPPRFPTRYHHPDTSKITLTIKPGSKASHTILLED